MDVNVLPGGFTMKKLIILTILAAAVTGFAAAGGLVFQLGVGYHSSYVGELPSDVDTALEDLQNMPLGIGGYVGLGYGFGEKKMFSLGAEFAPSWDMSFNPMGVSNFGYQARGFLKFEPAKFFTLTGFGGYAGSSFFGGDLDEWKSGGNVVWGARLTILFIYAEYAAEMPWDMSSVLKHDIGIGFAFFR